MQLAFILKVAFSAEKIAETKQGHSKAKTLGSMSKTACLSPRYTQEGAGGKTQVAGARCVGGKKWGFEF